MRDEKKQIRHEAITQAAYNLLATKGYDGTSMLSIAKAAKASNETLYRWYGDKRGLFEAMVKDNALNVKTILEESIDEPNDPVGTLTKIAPIFLTMLLGERAILLNRVAAADPTGELGAAISASGRNVIEPLIKNLMKEIGDKSNLDAQELTDCFLGLLIGDLQIKRAIGVQQMLSVDQIEGRCRMALRAFFKLLRQD